MPLERFENGPYKHFSSVAEPITIWDRLGFPDNDSALREAIKNGLSYSILKRVAAEIHIPEAVVSKALNLQSEQVVLRRKTQRFNAVESDRIHSLLVVFSAAVANNNPYKYIDPDGRFPHIFTELNKAIEHQKGHVSSIYSIYNAPKGVNRGGGYYSGRDLGSYVYTVRGGYQPDLKVSPFAAFGRSVDSAGFSGSAKIPRNVAAWVIADHSGLNIENIQTHSNEHFDSAPIYVMDKETGDFYEYEFDSETEEWTCSKNGESC